jgi:hypothetical protein
MGTITCRYMMYSNVFDCITSTQVWQYLSACRIFSSINKCWKIEGYLVAKWDRWGPRYDPQFHLHAWPRPMDGRAPAHLLLHSGVAPAYSCGAPIWRATDYCRAAWGNERASRQVSPLHSWPMSSMFHYKLVRFWHQFMVSFMHKINRRRNKGPVDWRAKHAPNITLWNVRGSSWKYYLYGPWHRRGPWVEYLRWLQL